jgi:hypothetical protein
LKGVGISHVWGGSLGITMTRLPHVARVGTNILSGAGFHPMSTTPNPSPRPPAPRSTACCSSATSSATPRRRCAPWPCWSGIRRADGHEIRARRVLLLGGDLPVAPALDLPPGARVLIPAFTFAAVPSAVVHADCQPVLVEVGENYRIDIDDFEAKLDDDIDAVIISHMRGHTSDMDAIMALAEARGIPVIEDAAHSLGTLWHGRKIGTIGKIGCFSFQSYKLVNAGEGGILITDDADLVARAVIMSGAYEHNWKKHKGPDATRNWPRPSRAGRTCCRFTTCGCRTCRPR